MRIFLFTTAGAPGAPPPDPLVEIDALPQQLPDQGFAWISCTRQELEAQLYEVQSTLLALTGRALVDLHVSDLLNRQLPSHYDYTSDYDILVFRRLANTPGGRDIQRLGSLADPSVAQALAPTTAPEPPAGLLTRMLTALRPAAKRRRASASAPLLADLDTSAVGFAVFDRVVLTVHPSDCLVRDSYAARLLQGAASRAPATGAQEGALHGVVGGAGHNDTRMQLRLLPASPADLMLRMVSTIVDGYLELRRDLTQQLDRWQLALLEPSTTFTDWRSLLASRTSLHQLDEVCEDQRTAVQDWLDALEAWPETGAPHQLRERELLMIRSRDVLEHIERVVHHVQRMERNAETAVQMHFSLQGNRANDIMRTLTVLTAIFLPLNLIAGIFGMNFESLPLIHRANGFWLAMGTMLAAAIGLTIWFWRQRYLNRDDET